jgi:hypothetical protein
MVQKHGAPDPGAFSAVARRGAAWVSILALAVLMAGCVPALYKAAGSGDIATVKALLDQGTDVNEKGGGGILNDSNALDVASAMGHTDVVRLLLDRGANVDKASGNMGWTPLSSAAYKGHTDIVQLLIERGADINRAIVALDKGVGTGNAIDLLKDFRREKTASQAVLARTPPTAPHAPAAVRSDIDNLPALRAAPNRNAYAIVIGIERYRQKLSNADFAVADAKAVTQYLVKVMGYPEENVITLLDDRALKSDLEKYFEKWLGNNVEQGGTVFVYFSGHGAPEPKSGSAYLVPYDGDPSFIDQTGYSLKRMYDALGRLPAKEIVVALDSCFSGAGGRSVVAKGTRPLVMNLQSSTVLPKNMTVLSASQGDQISSTYDEKGHGLFTYFLLKGIREGGVLRQDGSLRMDDLYGYLKPQVERTARKQFNNEQTPQLLGAKRD